MTERNYAIAIATLRDWLKILRQFFNQLMRSKTKTNRTLLALFFLRFE